MKPWSLFTGEAVGETRRQGGAQSGISTAEEAG